METDITNIENILFQQLENRGIKLNTIPRFIKDLRISFFDDPDVTLFQVNNRLDLLGWNDFQLDYHIFQLAKAYFEGEASKEV
jgi:hypothetical protein